MAQHTSPATYPTGGDYTDALQNPRLAFTDPHLAGGAVKGDDYDIPVAVSGNFASVFQVTGPTSERWAVKCFTRLDPDRHRRYAAIDTALRALHHRALVDFDYQPTGVMVNGHRYPMLKMRWIQAQGLMPWLENNRTNPDRVLMVANQLVDVVNALETASIAHGDLQHGNLLITDADELKLIDYDGMYVPQLKGLPPTEVGLANYQHPRRGDADYGPGLDRFSAWVIYISLLALAARPDLWRTLRRVDDDTKLLFAAEDYKNATASTAFKELRTSGPAHLHTLADNLTAWSRGAPSTVPALQPITLTATATAVPGQRTPTTDNDVPDWLTDHLPPTAATAPASVTSTAGARQEYRFTGSHLAVARIAAAVCLIGAGGATILATRVAWLAAVPVLVWVAIIVAGVTAMAAAYRTDPAVAERRRTEAALAQASQEGGDAEERRAAIRQQIIALDGERLRLLDTIDQQRQTAETVRARAEQEAQQALTRTLATLQAERNNPTYSRQTRENARLQQLIAEHVDRILASTIIKNSPPTMIDTKLAAALAAQGFNTAKDIVGYRTVGGHGRYDKTFLQRHHGDHGTYVPGIGDKRAAALMTWRQKIIDRAAQTAPSRLTTTQRSQITAEIDQHQRDLNTKAETARQQARQTVTTAKATETATNITLDQQKNRIDADQRTTHANLNRQINGISKEIENASTEAERLTATLDQLHGVSATRFLQTTLSIRRS